MTEPLSEAEVDRIGAAIEYDNVATHQQVHALLFSLREARRERDAARAALRRARDTFADLALLFRVKFANEMGTPEWMDAMRLAIADADQTLGEAE